MRASAGPDGVSRWTAHQKTISSFASMLRAPVAAGRPVIDKTGLTGKYDFQLYYKRSSAAPGDDDPAPILQDAIQEQLGLKLVDTKAPFDVIVVDRAERVPTAN